MVDTQLRSRGIDDQRVLQAMAELPRERFLPESVRASAYEDRAVAVGHDQTISQPFIVAYMTQQLSIHAGAKVLEIGTGTLYQTALLSMLAGHVFSVERIREMHERAVAMMQSLDLKNVTLVTGDGSIGLGAHAPFDRILVTASSPGIPAALVDQLVNGGILVIPVGGDKKQTIVRLVREGNRTVETPTIACRFVKLIGKAGWRVDA